MAVTITDRRSIVDEAETTTGWTPGSYGTTTTDVAELGAAVAESLAEASGVAYFTNATSFSLTNTCIYVYLFNNALQPVWTDGPNALLIGDGTNRVAFHMAGSDRRVFNHLDGPTSWQCAVLDGSQAATMDTAGDTTEIAGTFASLSLGAITQAGGSFITESKALGGGYNVAVDIIRLGNDGIRLTGGGVATEATASEIAAADRSTANQAAHGVFRELQPVAFGIQAPLTFGDTAAATDSRFIDSGISLIFEDRNISNDKYYFDIVGNTSATNLFQLSGSTLTTSGPYVSVSANTGDINTLDLDGVNFTALGNPITFSGLADAGGHTIKNCTFDGCGRIQPGNTTFQDNIVSSTTDTANGGLYIETTANTARWQNLDFISGGSGHAIYITATGTYTFTNYTYTSYGANATADSVIYNNSGGAVTINLTGGDVPTVNNGTSATTTLVSSATLTITNIVTESEVHIVDVANNLTVTKNESVNGTVQSVTVAAGGTGYDNADILTVSGGTGTAATLNITTDGSGVIVSAGVETAGEYSIDPTNPVSHTGGSGSSGTFNLNIKGSFEYAYGGTPIYDIVIFHLNYKESRFVNFPFPSANSGLLVSQVVDRVYLNN